jgi:hypothetical protein
MLISVGSGVFVEAAVGEEVDSADSSGVTLRVFCGVGMNTVGACPLGGAGPHPVAGAVKITPVDTTIRRLEYTLIFSSRSIRVRR